MLKIGFSSCFFHADPVRPIFKGKTLLYLEESMIQWLMQAGALPVLIPRESGIVKTKEIIAELDGLLLQGGSDVSPKSYGLPDVANEWPGDYERDQYEIELIHECVAQNKPILGVCRGIQILNVAFGGTLYYDINTQIENSLVHRNWDVYDSLVHEIELKENSILRNIYNKPSGSIISIHHQAIDKLAADAIVEAVSTEDQIIEAIRMKNGEKFIFAVQWHPEFQKEEDDSLLSNKVLLNKFLEEVKIRK